MTGASTARLLPLLALAVCAFAPLATLTGELAGWPSPSVLAERLAGPLAQRTLGLALVAALTSAVIGAATGAALVRSPRALRAPTRAVVLVPLLLPPYVLATAALRAFGPAAACTTSAGLVLGCALAPLVALGVERALARRSAAEIDAARLSLGPARQATLAARAAAGPLAFGALVVFACSAVHLAVPMVLRADVYALEILARMSLFDLAGALEAMVVPVAPSLVALGLAALACPRRALGPDGRWRPDQRPGSRLAAAAALAIGAGLGVAPLGALALDVGGTAEVARALATAGDELFTSVAVATAAAALATALAFPAAAALASLHVAARGAILAAFALTCALPGACVGIGLQRLAAASPAIATLGETSAILVAAAVARAGPIALLLAYTAVRRREGAALEAARMAGLGAMQRFFAIELPRIQGDVAFAFVVTFALAVGELEASTLVAPPGGSTLAIRLASLLHYGEDAMVSALCLVQAFLVLAAFAAASLVAGRCLGGLDERQGR